MATSTPEITLQLSQSVDCRTLIPEPIDNMIRGLHANCIAFHQEKPLLAVGCFGYVAVYDMLSGARTGRLDLRSMPITLCFNGDASMLVIATDDWVIYGVSTTSWKARTLVPRKVRPDKKLDKCLLALTSGVCPSVFFCKYGKETVRSAQVEKRVSYDAKGKPIKEAEPGWGERLKLDVVKPIVALASHPHEPTVYILFIDGLLRGYTTNDGLLLPQYSVQVMDAAKSIVVPPVLILVSHPLLDTAALCMLGVQLGATQPGSPQSGVFTAVEMPIRADPRVVYRQKLEKLDAVLGVGFHQAMRVAMFFVEARHGVVETYMYKVHGRSGQPVVKFAEMSAEPDRTLSTLLERKPEALAGTAAEGGSWKSMWSPSTAWSLDVATTVILGRQFDPLVTQVIMHPLYGTVAVLLQPPPLVMDTPNLYEQLMHELAPEEAAIARHTASVPVLRPLLANPHFGGSSANAVQAMHTKLDFWQASEQNDSASLMLPCHLYYLRGHSLMKYALLTGASSAIFSVGTEPRATAEPRIPRYLLHSSKQQCWLVFSEVPSQLDDQRSRWLWTLITNEAMEESSTASWQRPGKYGSFLGAEDAMFVILDVDYLTLSIYMTNYTNSQTMPVYLMSFDYPARMLLTGPPMDVLKVEQQRKFNPMMSSAFAAMSRIPEVSGGGVVMWQEDDGCLCVGNTPGVPYMREGGALPATSDQGVLNAAVRINMVPGELVLQVAWQSLDPQSTQEEPRFACGLLTTHRVALLSQHLKVLAEVDVSAASLGVSPAVSSMLWVGPALLFMRVSGQVMQLTWTGAEVQVASVSPYPFGVLAAASADRLVLLRAPSGTANWEITIRPISLVQPLLYGWTSLAAAGLAPGGLPATRQVLRLLLSKYDATQVTVTLMWHLLRVWCVDVAAALVNHSPTFDADTKLAVNAAAGKWFLVATSLAREYEHSAYHPAPPPPGSHLHSKLVAAAAGALMHGQISRATDCLRLAGEWQVALSVSACQGDMAGVAKTVSHAQNSRVPPDELQEVERVAGLIQGMYQGKAQPSGSQDWKLRLLVVDGAVLEEANQWELGGAGRLPWQVTTSEGVASTILKEGEVGTLQPTKAAGLQEFFGQLDAATLAARREQQQKAAAAAAAAAAATAPALGSAAAVDMAEQGEHDAFASAASVAQAAARNEFLAQKDRDSFYSDDEDDAVREGPSTDLEEGSSVKPRFKITIKAKEEVAAAPADSAALKEAAKNLRVLPPPIPGKMGAGGLKLAPPPGHSRNMSNISSSSSTTDIASESAQGSGPQPSLSTKTSNVSTSPPAAAAPKLSPPVTSTGAAAPAPVAVPKAVDPLKPLNSMELYKAGVSFMESGNWSQACAHFSRALEALAAEPKGPSHTAKVSFCASYFAAVRLLAEATAGTGAREARLYRYLAALKLDDKHSMALLREAVNRNRAIGNYRYAADQLTALVTKCIGTAPDDYVASLQADIEACDRAGQSNKDIPADERVDDFVTIVSAATSAQDVEDSVRPLLSH